MGISRVVPAPHLLTAVQQARDAFASTGRVGGADRLARFDDLGVLRLLIVLAQGPELANYVEDELGKLLAHDAASTNPMLPTLRAILDSDGRKTDAAKSLHVQRRTLYYRMERIESLLDCSLAEPETRQRLLLAIRGLDLLGKRSQRSSLLAPGSLRNAQA
jgi:purine catabolism regulator